MKRKFKYFAVVLLIIASFVVLREVTRITDRRLKFYMLDVGQGDAFFIETPSKNQILIDGGPDKSVLRELGEIMPFYDHSLDLVILTYPRQDGAAGLAEVFKNYRVGEFIDNGEDSSLAVYQEIKRSLANDEVSYREVRRGQEIILDDGVKLKILYPDSLALGSNLRQNALVMKLEYANNSFLLMSDAEKATEYYLIERGDNLESDVLKVGYHGAKISSNELFLQKVNPSYSLISAGKENKSRYPDSEVITNLKNISAKIFRTDINGRVKISSNGANLDVISER